MKKGKDVQRQFGLAVRLGVKNLEHSVLERRKVFCYQFTIVADLVDVVIFIDVGEIVAVDHTDVTTVMHELQRLIDVLHLVIVGMGFAVGTNQTVDAEVDVVGFVAKVTTVGEVAVFLQSLVHPVPDGAATDGRVGVNHVPVLLQVAHGVAHGMCVLTHHERFVGDCLCILSEVVGVEVTVVPDATVTAVAVVERRTGAVQLFYSVVHRLDVRTYSPFVAEAPENDAGMVEIALHERFRPVHMTLLPSQVVAHLFVGIAVTMGLVIGFVHHIDAPTVA